MIQDKDVTHKGGELQMERVEQYTSATDGEPDSSELPIDTT